MWQRLKNCWKSRIMWLSAILVVTSAAQLNISSISGFFDSKTYGAIVFGLAIVNGILRFDTKKDLKDK